MNLALNAAPSPISNPQRRMVLLAPEHAGNHWSGPSQIFRPHPNREMYSRLLASLQRFRGSIYLQDGAIHQSDLTPDGLHRLEADTNSWHVLALDGGGDVCGCSRYRIYPRHAPFSDLAVASSALAHSDVWGSELRLAVDRERQIAARRNASFVEVGGWAISADLRRTTEALRIALATYALAKQLGGCIGITTATVRHNSASVLRKIGGQSLVSSELSSKLGSEMGCDEFPRYFDPQYDCEMEILRFDSAAANPRFVPWIEQIRSEMALMEVITAGVQLKPRAIPAPDCLVASSAS